jgi:hypothetical protein
MYGHNVDFCGDVWSDATSISELWFWDEEIKKSTRLMKTAYI